MDLGDIAVGGVLLAMALKREVEAIETLDGGRLNAQGEMLTWYPCLRHIE